MKPLYRRVVEQHSAILGVHAPPRKTASLETIRAAETRLGISLPATYKAFASEVGHADWPVYILSVEALEREPPGSERPA